MDVFRINCFIRFRQLHSNNRWHKFNASIRKFFGCIDHNLAWLNLLENNVLMGSPTSSIGTLHGVLYCRTSTMTYSRTLFLVIVENKSGSKLSVHTITPQNDVGESFTHSASTVSTTFFRQLMLFYYGLSFRSPRLHFYSFSCLLHL